MTLNKKVIEQAKKILKTETELDENEILYIIDLLSELAQIMVEQQWDLILQEIETKY